MLLVISSIFAILVLLNVDAHPKNTIVNAIEEDRFLNNSKINEDLDDTEKCPDTPCKNDGTCNTDGTCSCPPMTSGPFCEVLNCSSVNPGCKNSGGTCRYITSLQRVICSCSNDKIFNFKLKICTNKCPVEPCKNGGACLDLRATSFICNCLPGTFGVYCEEVDCSRVNPQCEESGGLCVYSEENFRPSCKCPDTRLLNKEFGKCEEKCPRSECKNGGMCNRDGQCACLPGTHGIKCEKVDCDAVNPACEQSGGRCVFKLLERRVACDCPSNKKLNEGSQECIEGITVTTGQKVPILVLVLFGCVLALLIVLGSCTCWSNLQLKKLIRKT